MGYNHANEMSTRRFVNNAILLVFSALMRATFYDDKSHSLLVKYVQHVPFFNTAPRGAEMGLWRTFLVAG